VATETATKNKGPYKVYYADLGGGRNTRKDSHALERNELAASINTWMFAGHTVGKRPGSTPAITVSGATGSGAPCKGMATARFGNVTSVIEQSNSALYTARPGVDTTYTNIGSIGGSANPIAVAQMYDPVLSANAAFIVDGVDVPKTWKGPGNSIATVGNAPLNHSGGAMITPTCVSTLNNSLWYAGEPTEPTAVYVSDPNTPESFTFGGQLPGASYLAYFVGYNDGIAGGNITAIMPLGNAMIVYKQSAIYSFQYVGYYGDVGPWAIVLLSGTVGTNSPQSVVSFDTFHCFLGIDGVYAVDLNGLRKVSEGSDKARPLSDNNPDLFDGPLAAILNRTNAVGVRFGSKYLLFYDNGGVLIPQQPNIAAPLGYPNAGVWFDFLFKDADGLPCCGEIRNMPVAGVAPLRGPADVGNFVWGSGAADKTGIFGSLNGDFGGPIGTIISGKSDFFEQELGDSSPDSVKTCDNIALAISLVNPVINETLNFLFAITANYAQTFDSTATTVPSPVFQGTGNVVGSAVVGTAVIGGGGGNQAFQITRGFAQNNARGNVLQVSFQESSIYPWNTLGYIINVSSQEAIIA
jgi:hypothetical protein